MTRASKLSPDVLTKRRKYPRHIFIPDTQVRPKVPTSHIGAAGNYCAEKEPDVIVVAGDWWDMASLSVYEDKGSSYWDEATRTVSADIYAGNHAMELFLAPIKRRISRSQWRPRLVFTEGNHEDRIRRAVHANPVLKDTVSRDRLSLGDFEFHPFLETVKIDGVLYSHYFVNPQSLTKNILGGTMDNRLNKIKQSFTMGHQQTRMFGSQYTLDGREIMGLVAGAFYQHDEEYMGPQGNHYWRGIVVCNEVYQGRYDPCFVSLQYLVDNYS